MELVESPLGRNDGMRMLEKPEEAIRPSDLTVSSFDLRRPSSSCSCLVISDGWPAWWSSAGTLCGSSNMCYMGNDQLFGELEKLEVVDWEQGDRWDQAKERWNKVDLIFGSGPLAFLERLLALGCPLTRLLFSVDVVPIPRAAQLRKLPFAGW
jgi:hypothetical protein